MAIFLPLLISISPILALLSFLCTGVCYKGLLLYYIHTLRCISPHHNIIIMHIIPCNVVTTHSIDVRKYCLCNLLFLCWSALVRLCNRSWLVYIINASYADGMVVMWTWALISRSANAENSAKNTSTINVPHELQRWEYLVLDQILFLLVVPIIAIYCNESKISLIYMVKRIKLQISKICQNPF